MSRVGPAGRGPGPGFEPFGPLPTWLRLWRFGGALLYKLTVPSRLGRSTHRPVGAENGKL